MIQFKRLLYPLRKEVFLSGLSVLTGLLSAGLNLSRPILLGMIVDSLVTAKFNKIPLLVSLYAASWIMTWMMSVYLQYLTTKVSQKILKQLRIDVFKHFLSLPFVEVEKVKQGQIEAYTMSDLPAWTSIYGSVLAQIVHSIAQFVGAIIALSHLNFYLTMIITPFLILSFIIPWIMSKKLRNISNNTQKNKSLALEGLTGMIQGVQDLISLGGKLWGIKHYSRSANDIYKSEIKQGITMSILRISGSISETGAYILILAVGTSQVLNHHIAVGELVSFLSTIEMLFFPVRNSSDLFGMIQFSIGAASRVWEFLDKKVMDKPRISSSSFIFKNVSFDYPDLKGVLKNINFSVNHGDLVVVIGESGSGKSTLLKMIAGLYPPTKGNIEYTGQPSFSVTWQDPFLYNTSVIENLFFDNEINQIALNKSAELLNINSFIQKLPEGYHTEVKNGGFNFSGGQRRRLAILRSYLKNPNLLILDEPMTGLDIQNQENVWGMIEELRGNVTLIITSHDLELAKRADKVIVLSKGEIVGFGSPNKVIT